MKRKNLILLTAAIFISLFVAEVIVRVTLPQPGFVPFSPDKVSGLLAAHPTRHYKYAPGFVGKITTKEYLIDVAINSIGLRDNEISSDDKVNILAAGNSFTVGYGVQAEESWPSQLELYINDTILPSSIEVLNSGVSGYGLTQIRLQIEELLYLEPSIVVLGLYPSRYGRISNPYVFFNGSAVRRNMVHLLRPADGGYFISGFGWRLQQVHFWTMENFHVAGHLLGMARKLQQLYKKSIRSNRSKGLFISAVADKLSPVLLELGAIDRLLRDRGIDLVVLLVNHQEENGSFSPLEKEYNAIIKSYCKNSGIIVFDPVPYFESSSLSGSIFRIGKDHHWSKHAHALVGKQLGKFLLKHSWLQSLLERKNAANISDHFE